MTGFGPLFQLQVLGTLCPCLEKSENKNARQAVKAINRACRRVQWQPGSSSSQRKGGFLGGFFGKGSGSSGTSASASSSQSPSLAKVVLRDSGGDGQPELFVDPIRNVVVAAGDNDSKQQQSPAAGYKLNIKLRRVDKVSLDEATGQIVLTAKRVTSSRSSAAEAKELLRFSLLQQNKETEVDPASAAASNDIVPVTSDVRNAIMHHFMVIVEWERQRRADLLKSDPDGYYSDEDEDEDQPNFLQARAQKAAHFAQRELELQQTRQQREQRKAQLVAQSGGLKYTALAMANMHNTEDANGK